MVCLLLLSLVQTYIVLDVAKLFGLTFLKLTFMQMFGCLSLIGLILNRSKKDGESPYKFIGDSFVGWMLTWGILYIFHWVMVVWP